MICTNIFYKKSKTRLEILDEMLAKGKQTLEKTNQPWYFRCRFFGAANLRRFVKNMLEPCTSLATIYDLIEIMIGFDLIEIAI